VIARSAPYLGLMPVFKVPGLQLPTTVMHEKSENSIDSVPTPTEEQNSDNTIASESNKDESTGVGTNNDKLQKVRSLTNMQTPLTPYLPQQKDKIHITPPHQRASDVQRTPITPQKESNQQRQ
jgi:hypothetical protein